MKTLEMKYQLRMTHTFLTNLNETYDVQSMIYFWGSNIKLEVFEMVYGTDRYDSSDPELFMAHVPMIKSCNCISFKMQDI